MNGCRWWLAARAIVISLHLVNTFYWPVQRHTQRYIQVLLYHRFPVQNLKLGLSISEFSALVAMAGAITFRDNVSISVPMAKAFAHINEGLTQPVILIRLASFIRSWPCFWGSDHRCWPVCSAEGKHQRVAKWGKWLAIVCLAKSLSVWPTYGWQHRVICNWSICYLHKYCGAFGFCCLPSFVRANTMKKAVVFLNRQKQIWGDMRMMNKLWIFNCVLWG